MAVIDNYVNSVSINPADGKPMPNVNVVSGGISGGGNAKDHETLSVGGTAVGFSKTVSGVTKAVITTETADIRYWVDGTNPTSTQGHLVKAGGVIELDSAGQITKFKAIAVSDAAVLQVSYF